MNTTQTPPAAPRHATLPALSPLARAVFADWDNPAISELQLAERHALTLEALDHLAQTPAFQAALAQRRRLRQQRLESYLQSAQDHAAQVFIHLSSRPPDSTTAAKEIRLALKELLRLRGGPPDAQPATSRGADLQSAIPRGADLQSASRAQPEPVATPPMQSTAASPPSLSPEQTELTASAQDPRPRTLRSPQDPAPDSSPTPLPSGGVGAAAPTPQPTDTIANTPPPPHNPPHRSKYPRGCKPRPKPKSR